MAYFCFCRMLGEQASDVGERRMSHTLRIGKVALTVQSAAHTPEWRTHTCDKLTCLLRFRAGKHFAHN